MSTNPFLDLYVQSHTHFLLYFGDETIRLAGHKAQVNKDWCVYIRNHQFVWYCLHTRKEISSFPSPFPLGRSTYANEFELLDDRLLILYEDMVFLYSHEGECLQKNKLQVAASSIYAFENFFTAESKEDSWCWHIYRTSPFAHLGDVENLNSVIQWICYRDTLLFSLDTEIYRIDLNNSETFHPYVSARSFIDRLIVHDDKLWIQNSARGDYWLCPLLSFDLKNMELLKTTDMDAKITLHRNTLLIWTWVNNSKVEKKLQWFGRYTEGGVEPLWFYPKEHALTHAFCIDTDHYGVITHRRGDDISILHIIRSTKQVIRTQQLGRCNKIVVKQDTLIIISKEEIQQISIDSLVHI